ncbi:MAG: 50S ribosomal protein L35 [Nitrospinota bacterium]|nr:50S ribosomal protein L35 [Nitrospinota bacterium]
MPKLKTNRGAAKRFKVTSGGKVKFNHSHRRHILTNKTTKRKRELRHSSIANPVDEKMIKRLLPYS